MFPFLRQFRLLGADLHLLQACQLAQPGVEHIVGLDLVQTKGGHERRLGLVLGADDADHLVDIEEGDQQPLQQMQPAQHLVEPVLEAAGDRRLAETQPGGEDLLEVHDPRPAVQANEVHIDPIGALQVGGGEEVGHEPFHRHPAVARHQDQARRRFVVGLVTQVLQPGQLLVAHLGGDLLQDAVARDLIGQMGDDDVALLQFVAGALAQAAVAGLIEPADLLGGGDDRRRRGIVGAGDEGHQVKHSGPGMVEEVDAGPRHLAQVMGWDVGGHAHGDTRRPVEQ